jgi:hypothetical protein
MHPTKKQKTSAFATKKQDDLDDSDDDDSDDDDDDSIECWGHNNKTQVYVFLHQSKSTFDKTLEYRTNTGEVSMLSVTKTDVNISNTNDDFKDASSELRKFMETGGLGLTKHTFAKRNNSLTRTENDAIRMKKTSVYVGNDSIKGMGMRFFKNGEISMDGYMRTFDKCKTLGRVKCIFNLKRHSYGFYCLEEECYHWEGPTGICSKLLLRALKYDKKNKNGNPIYYTK